MLSTRFKAFISSQATDSLSAEASMRCSTAAIGNQFLALEAELSNRLTHFGGEPASTTLGVLALALLVLLRCFVALVHLESPHYPTNVL